MLQEKFSKILLLFPQTCALTILNASYNEITELPPVIGRMKVLEDLNLGHNAIESLPDEITGLKYLEVKTSSVGEVAASNTWRLLN